ncbi:hypothetical protein FXV77_09445 [Sphingobacterium phlebotomi]|uniref:Uncharacterized protein n=1 Tax=Sphingobacterium phlebotomi TaxID=2605433 RepID=A0A5D4H9K3_9SPHI|nr:hypothetical protein [Sphingobacterium phlebotomi]TYR36135.1 hypothetical protein FXV77_09445 [Sphingobacterium phlebotomi]
MEEATNRCTAPRDFIVVFKSGAIINIEKACLFIKTVGGRPGKTYEFYRNEAGQDRLISSFFDINSVDAIFKK